MNWLAAKLLSLTSTSERRPSGSVGPSVMPSMLSSGIPSVSQVEQQRLLHRPDAAEHAGDAVEAVHVVRAGERDRVELDRVARAGRADRERALHREHELVVERQQLDEPVDRELVGGTGASAIGSVK